MCSPTTRSGENTTPSARARTLLGPPTRTKEAARKGRAPKGPRTGMASSGERFEQLGILQDHLWRSFWQRRRRPLARKGRNLKAELPISLEEAYSGGAKVLDLEGENIRLKLKPGIWDGQIIQIAGKGASGIGGAESGDLYITFSILPHPGTDSRARIYSKIFP